MAYWRKTIDIKQLIADYEEHLDTRKVLLSLQETFNKHEDLKEQFSDELEELLGDDNVPDEDEVNFFLDSVYDYGDNTGIWWGL